MKYNSYSSRKREFSIYYIFFCKTKFIKNLNLIFKIKIKIFKTFFPVKISKYENFKFKKKKKNFF